MRDSSDRIDPIQSKVSKLVCLGGRRYSMRTVLFPHEVEGSHTTRSRARHQDIGETLHVPGLDSFPLNFIHFWWEGSCRAGSNTQVLSLPSGGPTGVPRLCHKKISERFVVWGERESVTRTCPLSTTLFLLTTLDDLFLILVLRLR